jgi:hypothetical protein
MVNNIYYLHNGDFIPRYVGLTTKPLEYRLAQHLSDERHNQHKINWIRKYKDTIEIFSLEDGDFSIKQLKQKEVYWIKRLKSLGYNLLNATEGGDYSPNKGRKSPNKGKTKYSNDLIQKIVKDYVPYKFGYGKLSKKYNIPQTTIERYIANKLEQIDNE